MLSKLLIVQYNNDEFDIEVTEERLQEYSDEFLSFFPF